MRYIKFSKEQINRANNKDIIALGESKGDSFKKLGSGYISLVTKGLSVMGKRNKWHNFYTGVGGGAIKYLMENHNYDFKSAVAELLDIDMNNNNDYKEYNSCLKDNTQDDKEDIKPKVFRLPPENKTNKCLYYYLRKVRNIDSDIINTFYKLGKMYEERQFHNVVFLGYDEKNEIRYAQKRSTFKNNNYRGVVSGSNCNYSFNFVGKNNKLFVFESPIDMMSFITLNNRDWKANNYISLSGVSRSPLVKFLEMHPNIKEVHMALDNDDIGQEYNNKYKEELILKDYEVEILIPENKDWNEDLCHKTLEENQNYNIQMYK